MLDLPVGESMFILLSTIKGTDIADLAAEIFRVWVIDSTWTQYQVCSSCDSNFARAGSKLLYSMMDGNLPRGIRTRTHCCKGVEIHTNDELQAVSMVICTIHQLRITTSPLRSEPLAYTGPVPVEEV